MKRNNKYAIIFIERRILMKNGIVILNYNDSENTKLILDDIKNYKILDKIIIVDNNSTDNSIEELKKFENDKIKLIVAKENKGYAAGNNLGIKYLIEKENVDNIIISNPDIIISEEDIEKLIKDLKNKDVSVIAPVIKEPTSISRGWKLPTFLSEIISNIPYIRKFEANLLSYPPDYYKTNLTKVDVVKGCFFIIKKEVIKDINYFDSNTFLYYEEIIMAKKLKEKGYNSYVDNNVTVIHALSKSVDKSLKRIEKFVMLKNSQLYYEKNINNMNIVKIMLLRLFYYIYLFGLKIESKIRK